MSILENLRLIKFAKSQANKSTILKQLSDTNDWSTLEQVISLLIDPNISFNLNGVNTSYALSSQSIISLSDAVNSIRENLVTGKITGNAAKSYIFQITQLMSKDDATVVDYIVNRSYDLNLSAKIANKFLTNKIDEIPIASEDDEQTKGA